MWVAIDCRSKNWVAVLKGLGSTALLCKKTIYSRFSHETVSIKETTEFLLIVPNLSLHYADAYSVYSV
jgi:hypothetical protein